MVRDNMNKNILLMLGIILYAFMPALFVYDKVMNHALTTANPQMYDCWTLKPEVSLFLFFVGVFTAILMFYICHKIDKENVEK